MANLIQIDRISKSFGPKDLLDEASLAIDQGEHIGFVGPNGAGKTTLFKILVGEDTADTGRIVRTRGLRIGYLRQESNEVTGDLTVLDCFADSVKPIWELMKSAPFFGIPLEHFEKRMGELSGGQRMRIRLLALLGTEPDLMLLDEPTNYLDLETLLVLEKFLQELTTAFVLISHDREFLKRTTNATVELDGRKLTKFPSHIDDYLEYREMLEQHRLATAANIERRRQEILDFANRFRAKASKAAQVQSRLKELDRLDEIEVIERTPVARVRIPEPGRTGKVALRLQNVTLGYSQKAVLSSVDLDLVSGHKLGVVGYNGAGKSTLLKGVAGRITPLSGEIKLGHEVSIAYYGQHVAEELNLSSTVWDELQAAAHPDVRKQEILDLAGALLFRERDLEKKIQVLSGGERARVGIGSVLLKKASLLILDEVTNHLDFQTVEELTKSLREYPGTILFVSHDRGFVRRVATEILEVRDGHAFKYPGDYDDYVWSVSQRQLKEMSLNADAHASEKRTKKKESRSSDKRQNKDSQKRLAALEKEFQDLQARQEQLAQSMTQQKGEDLARLALESKDLEKQLASVEAEWERLLASMESSGV